MVYTRWSSSFTCEGWYGRTKEQKEQDFQDWLTFLRSEWKKLGGGENIPRLTFVSQDKMQ